MKKSYLALVSVFAFCLSSLSLANGGDLVQFFKNTEGRWEGTGVRTTLQADGRLTSIHFTLETEVRYQREQIWNSSSELTTENHVVEYPSSTFDVRGDELFAGVYSPTDPVLVIVSSPTQLTYQYRRYQPFTGRVFDFTIRTELLTPKHWHGNSQVAFNGVIIEEEDFDLQK